MVKAEGGPTRRSACVQNNRGICYLHRDEARRKCWTKGGGPLRQPGFSFKKTTFPGHPSHLHLNLK